MEIVENFDEKSYNNNGKPWKSSRILRLNPNCFIFHYFHHFSPFFVFFYIFTLSHLHLLYLLLIYLLLSYLTFSFSLFLFFSFSLFFFFSSLLFLFLSSLLSSLFSFFSSLLFFLLSSFFFLLSSFFFLLSSFFFLLSSFFFLLSSFFFTRVLKILLVPFRLRSTGSRIFPGRDFRDCFRFFRRKLGSTVVLCMRQSTAVGISPVFYMKMDSDPVRELVQQRIHEPIRQSTEPFTESHTFFT